MSRRFSIFSSVLILIITGIFFLWSSGKKEEIIIPREYQLPVERKSLQGTPENPQARADYLNRMLIDPATGEIPKNIRSRELTYSGTLPTTNSNPGGRVFEIQNWRSRGPINVGGRTRGAAMDLSDENILVAGGVSGGMWRSTNNGTVWDRITQPE
jgi:hypothetical protein